MSASFYNDDEKGNKLNASEDEITLALEKLGVSIPEGAVFEEKEAFDRLQKGYFLSVGDREFEVLELVLDYELDTKGFYQPVYTFSVSWDEIESTINIPAIQK